MSASLTIGDVVTPKCGGPSMVVVDLFQTSNSGSNELTTTARAMWIDTTAVREFIAPVACFDLVSPAKQP